MPENGLKADNHIKKKKPEEIFRLLGNKKYSIVSLFVKKPTTKVIL
jgi:hypothetical protein